LQPPQSVTVVSDRSHPFTGLPSQLPQPLEQLGAQAPATHAAVPCGFVQASPHAPQLETSFARFRQVFEQHALL
jgi:hypothetical protein